MSANGDFNGVARDAPRAAFRSSPDLPFRASQIELVWACRR